MGQIIFHGFHRAFGRFCHSKYFRVRLIFGVGKATLMVFRRWQRAGKLSIELKILFSLWSGSEGEHGRYYFSLIFSTTSSEVCTKVEPCCSLQLCWTPVLDLWCPPDQIHRFGRASQLAISRWPF